MKRGWRIWAFAALLVAPTGSWAHDDAGIGPSHLEAAAAERALLGAEWLAVRVEDGREGAPEDAAPFDLVEALMWRAEVERAEVQGDFAGALVAAGYDDALWSVAAWMEEFTDLVAAYQGGRSGLAASDVAAIDAELLRLPSVPLDEAGEVERDDLMDRRALAAVPDASRAVAAANSGRIAAVLARATGKAAP